MSSKKILTIFGATGKQGGSVLDIVLGHADFNAKYALRGITRDPSSAKSAALASKGVEMVKAELDDVESMKAAIKGSYGVFGVTDFWSILDKQREIQQGKNIFEASKAEGVTHLVFSSLPYAKKLTNGELKRVDHFDSKAEVEEYIEVNKGSMIASYFMPAMFIDFAKGQINNVDGKPTLAMPFASDIAWPLLEPKRDGGKFVMGLFEGGATANSVNVHGVSTWTTPNEVVAALSKESGKEVVFKTLPPDVFAGFLPEAIRSELLETMLLVGGYSYYGKGEEKNQEDVHDKWLIKDADLISYPQWAHENGPWVF